ncbi:hypothetical protein HYPSUDRAFT_125921 [Hypholoma sublateritium FD-334 SS-4]|uniref:Nuclear segregation protein Bfr1 n=1 Tax=Hypholoma sublateritium (strain FD-334 SS-4) TaxID=945553 RepID=A0A0D2QFF6_HYPSF|nr:hypothetical protein HYPSUDRAFT_125921 [Hypholoma sublateritium FD-334 SS-4]
MPAPKTKSSAVPANGSAKGKAPSTSGTATPISIVDKDTSEQLAAFAGGKPDKKVYDAEQARIKTEIDALQLKLSAVRDKISFATKSGPGNDRRNILRAELDGLRDKQSTNKNSRGKLIEQSKALKDGIAKKTKDLQAAKAKIPFKTVAEVDAHIKYLEKGVESGNMKLAEEKRALQEISTTKRSRKIVEGFETEQTAIDADRAKVAELSAELDDPASQAISKRYDDIKAELDELKKESDEAYAGRSKLFEERDKIQSALSVLFTEKREQVQRFREANDNYYTKLNEDRARRAEKARAQRAAEEAEKKKAIAEQLLEEAQVPAFQAEIQDCQTLIDYFTGKTTTTTFVLGSLTPKTEVAGVPKLDIRKVEDAPEGAVIRKKKGEVEESYFVASKPKGKGQKAPKANGSSKPKETKKEESGEAPAAPASSGSLNVPLPTLSALLVLSIPPPASNADVPRLIEDLNIKKTWFEANQARVTASNITKAEAEIQRLSKSDAPAQEATTAAEPAGVPTEPIATPQAGDAPAVPVASEDVIENLEEAKAKEDETEEASSDN